MCAQQLVVLLPTQWHRYSYDATNDLTQTTTYTQDLAADQSQILAGTTGMTTTDYLYGQDIAPLAAMTGGTRTWYGIDGQGSVRQILNDSGTVLGVASYDPFGQIEADSSLIGPFGYTGELQDPTTGQEYLRARWYQPGSGTLLGVDLELASTGQPYSYAADNPVNGSDPGGTIPQFGWDCAQGYSKVDGLFEGHDFAESFYLWHLGLQGVGSGTCEYDIPYANYSGSNPRGTVNGVADLVEDYRGNGSKLWEFAPAYDLVDESGLTYEYEQALWYRYRALDANQACAKSGNITTLVRRPGVPFGAGNIGIDWNAGIRREFSLSDELSATYGSELISPPVYFPVQQGGGSDQYLYIVVLCTHLFAGGVVGFDFYRLKIEPKDLRQFPNRRGYYATHPLSAQVPLSNLRSEWEHYGGRGVWDPAPVRAAVVCDLTCAGVTMGRAILNGAAATITLIGGLFIAAWSLMNRPSGAPVRT